MLGHCHGFGNVKSLDKVFEVEGRVDVFARPGQAFVTTGNLGRLDRHHVRPLEHGLRHHGADVVVDVVEFLQQERQRLRVVLLHHPVGRVQLLDIVVVALD